MSNPPKRVKKKKKEPTQHPTNMWDAAIRAFELMHDLCATGNIVGVVFLGFFIWLMTVTLRLPGDSLDGALKSIVTLFSSELYYFFPLSTALVVSMITNVVQRKVYREDIRRLKDVRGMLMHGVRSGELQHLEQHSSCELSIEDV